MLMEELSVISYPCQFLAISTSSWYGFYIELTRWFSRWDICSKNIRKTVIYYINTVQGLAIK